MKKQIVSVILAITMIAGLLPFGAIYASAQMIDKEGNGVYMNISQDKLEYTGEPLTPPAVVLTGEMGVEYAEDEDYTLMFYQIVEGIEGDTDVEVDREHIVDMGQYKIVAMPTRNGNLEGEAYVFFSVVEHDWEWLYNDDEHWEHCTLCDTHKRTLPHDEDRVTKCEIKCVDLPIDTVDDTHILFVKVFGECETCKHQKPLKAYNVIQSKGLDNYSLADMREAEINESGDAIHMIGTFEKEEQIFFDGVLLRKPTDIIGGPDAQYNKDEGSIILTFTDDFLATVEDGEHELMVCNGDEFTVMAVTTEGHKLTELSNINLESYDEVDYDDYSEESKKYEDVVSCDLDEEIDDGMDTLDSDDTETETETESENDTATDINGGWEKAESPVVTEEIEKLVEKATEGLAGAAYTPVAYLESQLVAGTNHRVLCMVTPVAPDAKSSLAIVTIYESLDGNAEITEVVECDAELDIGSEDGGWQMPESPEVTDEAKAALEKATKDMDGASYEPAALVATQVVSGTNYAILCRVTTVTPGAKGEFVLVNVYEDTEGNAEIKETFEFASVGDTDTNSDDTSSDGTNTDTSTDSEPATDSEKPVRYGDANGDGDVNMEDVTTMQKHIAKLPVEIDVAASDLNGDNKVNMEDVVIAQKFIAKLIDALPISKEVEVNTEDDTQSGAWEKAESPVVTEEIKALTEKATKDIDGAAYEPIAYLEHQLVAGTYHRVLCMVTTVGADDAKSTLAIVTIYEDLEGKAEVTEVLSSTIDLADYAGGEGGWEMPETPELTAEAKTALEKATKDMDGVSMTPVALIATQVVSGTNYGILCEVSAVAPGAKGEYVIVNVAEDAEGNASLKEIFKFGEKKDDAKPLYSVDGVDIMSATVEMVGETPNLMVIFRNMSDKDVEFNCSKFLIKDGETECKVFSETHTLEKNHSRIQLAITAFENDEVIKEGDTVEIYYDGVLLYKGEVTRFA